MVFNEGMQLFYENRDCNIKSIAITADTVVADRLGVYEREIDFYLKMRLERKQKRQNRFPVLADIFGLGLENKRNAEMHSHLCGPMGFQ